MKERHVALLRGINVGRANRIAMGDLRALFERLGYGDVRTLLNSGNLVFTVSGAAASDAGSRIEKAMTTRLGVSARVIVIKAKEFAAIVAENPLGGLMEDPSRFLVTVLASAADRNRLEELQKKNWAPEALAVGRRAAYLWCAAGILKGPLNLAVSRALGDAGTSRNWATTLKLLALAEEEA